MKATKNHFRLHVIKKMKSFQRVDNPRNVFAYTKVMKDMNQFAYVDLAALNIKLTQCL